MAIGDSAVRDAFFFFTEHVDSLGEQFVSDDMWKMPCFTYILTRKQFNQMKVVCQRNEWSIPTSPAIPITREMIKHVLSSRKVKDKLSWQDCAEILATAFSVQSNVFVNRDYSEQTIVLNASSRVNVGGAGFYAMAIVDVSENNLAPVTAYHATEAKCKAIQR